jgi:hypothetical protein
MKLLLILATGRIRAPICSCGASALPVQWIELFAEQLLADLDLARQGTP